MKIDVSFRKDSSLMGFLNVGQTSDKGENVGRGTKWSRVCARHDFVPFVISATRGDTRVRVGERRRAT